MTRFFTCLPLGMLLLVGPVAGFAQQPADATSVAQPSPPALIIGSGDLIDVTMFDEPDLSGRYRVNEKGDLAMPLLGTIHVEGLTADQAAKLIEDRYVQAEILKPESSRATVVIEEYASQGITVTGEVKTAGVYPALGVRMLNDVVTAAGGLTTAAASKAIITHRNDPLHPTTVEYNPSALNPVIPQMQSSPATRLPFHVPASSMLAATWQNRAVICLMAAIRSLYRRLWRWPAARTKPRKCARCNWCAHSTAAERR